MKKQIILLSGIITLALIFMIGACAAEETNTAVITTPVVEMTAVQVPVPDATAAMVPADPTVVEDDIAPYDGPVGPGNPLYGLKIAFEDLDESFTFNETERLNKQMNNARLRLSEVKRELVLNHTDTADRALDLYWQKVNITQMRLNVFSSSNATGLLHAQEMITKHQMVLEGLMLSHPNNTGLARAYNNSLRLERRFEEKTQMRFERIMEKNNRTIVKAIRLEVRELERTVNNGEKQTARVQQTQKVQQAGGNGKDNGKGNRARIVPTGTLAQAEETPATAAATAAPDDKGDGNSRNTGNENRGQGNGKNK